MSPGSTRRALSNAALAAEMRSREVPQSRGPNRPFSGEQVLTCRSGQNPDSATTSSRGELLRRFLLETKCEPEQAQKTPSSVRKLGNRRFSDRKGLVRSNWPSWSALAQNRFSEAMKQPLTWRPLSRCRARSCAQLTRVSPAFASLARPSGARAVEPAARFRLENQGQKPEAERQNLRTDHFRSSSAAAAIHGAKRVLI